MSISVYGTSQYSIPASERLVSYCKEKSYLQPDFLDHYGPNIGDCVVILEEDRKKVWYWLHKVNGWELASQPRSYRKNRGEFLRPGSIPLKVCKDGTVLSGCSNVPELTVLMRDEDIRAIRQRRKALSANFS